MANKIDKVRKLHTPAITPPNEKEGRWQTYYKNSTGKRKCLKAGTENELLLKLVDLYFNKKHIDKMTFEKLFLEWPNYKKSVSNSPNTITWHRQHYNKYFASSALSRKEWVNVKTIPKGMFEYAVKKGYIDTSPMDKVFIYVKFRQVVKKTGKTQTYNR